eukprot:CAMPEP_0172306424 /NCGR_PEP_ID=MMETSP1058-20130122/7499_1 /TAXON_ID=83371 /ORGANISM="Detonula confervacea, Strain CCMP 353" /LENGTH=124 /DNA_ID=CAMNT_0013018305 /DNA_START=18 /DNA_END=392 /DNA_ORIENTATION=-
MCVRMRDLRWEPIAWLERVGYDSWRHVHLDLITDPFAHLLHGIHKYSDSLVVSFLFAFITSRVSMASKVSKSLPAIVRPRTCLSSTDATCSISYACASNHCMVSPRPFDQSNNQYTDSKMDSSP